MVYTTENPIESPVIYNESCCLMFCFRKVSHIYRNVEMKRKTKAGENYDHCDDTLHENDGNDEAFRYNKSK